MYPFMMTNTLGEVSFTFFEAGVGEFFETLVELKLISNVRLCMLHNKLVLNYNCIAVTLETFKKNIYLENSCREIV